MTRPISLSHRASSRGARRILPVLVLGVLAVLAAADRAGAYEQRRNTPSMGFGYGYGALNGSGVMSFRGADQSGSPVDYDYRHADFRWGGALGVHIRYSLDQSHAVGVTFEDLRYGRKSGLGNLSGPDQVAKQVQVNNVSFDYYVYLDRRSRITPYFQLGAGFHRDTFRFNKSDNLVLPIAPAANLGVGLEYFVRPGWSIDSIVRGYWFAQRSAGEWSFHGNSPVAASLQVGIQYYLLK